LFLSRLWLFSIKISSALFEQPFKIALNSQKKFSEWKLKPINDYQEIIIK